MLAFILDPRRGDRAIPLSTTSRTCRRLTVLAAALVVTPFAAGPAPGVTPTGLVAAYSFDEGTGTNVADLSGSGNAGTTANTSWVAGGRFGGALSFDGTSSWVTVP